MAPNQRSQTRLTHRRKGTSATRGWPHPARCAKSWKTIGTGECVGVPSLSARDFIAIGSPLHGRVDSVEAIAVEAGSGIFGLVDGILHLSILHLGVGIKLAGGLAMECWLLVALSTWRARGGWIVIHVVRILVTIHLVWMAKIAEDQVSRRAASDVPIGDCREQKQTARGESWVGNGMTGYPDACGEGTDRK